MKGETDGTGGTLKGGRSLETGAWPMMLHFFYAQGKLYTGEAVLVNDSDTRVRELTACLTRLLNMVYVFV